MCQRSGIYSATLPSRPHKVPDEKGEGKWQRISWDEALDAIALKIGRAREKYGPESVAFNFYDGERGNRQPRCAFMNALGSPMICGPDAHYCLRPQGVSCMVTFGRENYFTGHAGFDFANSKCILIWGANLFESQPSKGKDIIQEMKNGAKRHRPYSLSSVPLFGLGIKYCESIRWIIAE